MSPIPPYTPPAGGGAAVGPHVSTDGFVQLTPNQDYQATAADRVVRAADTGESRLRLPAPAGLEVGHTIIAIAGQTQSASSPFYIHSTAFDIEVDDEVNGVWIQTPRGARILLWNGAEWNSIAEFDGNPI